MNGLSEDQQALVASLAERLGAIEGVQAVVLGGSYARGRARPGSDIDIGLLYSDAAPFTVPNVREVAEDVNDSAGPVVTGFYAWGKWVNGGAWLTIGGQRVDLLYRSLDQLERVIADAEAGRYELDYAQQAPFGFFSPSYLGDVAACLPLVDPERRLEPLKRRVAQYPEALRNAVVADYLWAAEFEISAFAPKFAGRSDPYGTTACLARAVSYLVLVLFALNRRYWVHDKAALEEMSGFERVPRDFGTRIEEVFARPGRVARELNTSLERTVELVRETVELAGDLYRRRYPPPA